VCGLCVPSVAEQLGVEGRCRGSAQSETEGGRSPVVLEVESFRKRNDPGTSSSHPADKTRTECAFDTRSRGPLGLNRRGTLLTNHCCRFTTQRFLSRSAAR
jgi:hypothetical protein